MIQGEGFDLNCTVSPSEYAQDIYWFIDDHPDEIYTFFGNGTGSIGRYHAYLVGRGAKSTKVSETLYRLHIEQADRNKDKAAFKCKKDYETLSEKKEIARIYRKL